MSCKSVSGVIVRTQKCPMYVKGTIYREYLEIQHGLMTEKQSAQHVSKHKNAAQQISEREEEAFSANIILLLAKDLGYLRLTLILSMPCTNGHHQFLDIKCQQKAEGKTREGVKYYKICVYITLIVICNLNCVMSLQLH